jgi:hypothetical protein
MKLTDYGCWIQLRRKTGIKPYYRHYWKNLDTLSFEELVANAVLFKPGLWSMKYNGRYRSTTECMPKKYKELLERVEIRRREDEDSRVRY